MGAVPKPETKRDLALIKDYLKKTDKGWKYSISQLGVLYARFEGKSVFPLTAARIYQILNKHGVKMERKEVKKK